MYFFARNICLFVFLMLLSYSNLHGFDFNLLFIVASRGNLGISAAGLGDAVSLPKWVLGGALVGGYIC